MGDLANIMKDGDFTGVDKAMSSLGKNKFLKEPYAKNLGIHDGWEGSLRGIYRVGAR